MVGTRHLGPSHHDLAGQEAAGLHVPVLLQPVLAFLNVRPDSTYLDGTVGGGGHAEAILSQSAPSGQLLGLDRDQEALAAARQRLAPFGQRALLRHGSYADLPELAQELIPVDGVLLDLGLSSRQLADPQRGFSFSQEGPLDMRFDPAEDSPTAADLVNTLSVKELTDILYRFGEERQARRIAEAIFRARPLRSTTELAQLVAGVARRTGHIHPATRTFQALRIAVNQELETLSAALPRIIELLAPGGRLVVISFHSLEDRIVKRFIRTESLDCICPPEIPVCTCNHRARLAVLTAKPVRPNTAEIEANPRSRSARLRAGKKI
ncbi:MAG: 16S rRNA (cytosine(1402)-N(4))-methyltransferase RsmH [Anaerolineae bacterium]|nr:16S rRNA (cytosine(1402)-N(4))-methyltransferase RsmH [Anaerolineae bacterium]